MILVHYLSQQVFISATSLLNSKVVTCFVHVILEL